MISGVLAFLILAQDADPSVAARIQAVLPGVGTDEELRR